MVGDGGLEGFCCLAVEGARVGPDSGGGGRPGVGFGLKHLGGGQPPSLPWHAQPQTHEIQDANSNLGISKVFWNPCLGHDTIWRPGQEMKVYVDNNKHVDK